MLVKFIDKMGSDLSVVNAARVSFDKVSELNGDGSLHAFARVCNLRCKKDTQKETRDIANQIDKIAEQHFPISWKYLRSH